MDCEHSIDNRVMVGTDARFGKNSAPTGKLIRHLGPSAGASLRYSHPRIDEDNDGIRLMFVVDAGWSCEAAILDINFMPSSGRANIPCTGALSIQRLGSIDKARAIAVDADLNMNPCLVSARLPLLAATWPCRARRLAIRHSVLRPTRGRNPACRWRRGLQIRPGAFRERTGRPLPHRTRRRARRCSGCRPGGHPWGWRIRAPSTSAGASARPRQAISDRRGGAQGRAQQASAHRVAESP